MEREDCTTYRCLDDLRVFGIKALTGEACGLTMRILFDLTEDGKRIIEEFFRVNVLENSNWNGGDKDDPHVGSIMLPQSVCQELWIFAHVRAGTNYVFLGDYVRSNQWKTETYESINVTATFPDDTWKPRAFAVNSEEYMERFKSYEGESFHIARWFRKSTHPGNGIDNTHAMSGRTV